MCVCTTLHSIETHRSITSSRFFPIFFYSHLRNSWISSRVNFYTSNSGPFALPRTTSDFTVNRVTQSRYIEPKHANHVPRRFFRSSYLPLS